MKNNINRWFSNNKNMLLKQIVEDKIEKSRIALLDLKDRIMKEKLIKKQELEKLIDNILDENEHAKDDSEWLQIILMDDISKDDMFVQFIKTVYTWNIYLFIYEQKQDYELCHKIMKVLAAETEDLRSMVEAKFNLQPEDEEYIQEILQDYRIQKGEGE